MYGVEHGSSEVLQFVGVGGLYEADEVVDIHFEESTEVRCCSTMGGVGVVPVVDDAESCWSQLGSLPVGVSSIVWATSCVVSEVAQKYGGLIFQPIWRAAGITIWMGLVRERWGGRRQSCIHRFQVRSCASSRLSGSPLQTG